MGNRQFLLTLRVFDEIFQRLTRSSFLLQELIIQFRHTRSTSRAELRLTILIIRDILDDLHNSLIINHSKSFILIGSICSSDCYAIHQLRFLLFLLLFFILLNILRSNFLLGYCTSCCSQSTIIKQTLHIREQDRILRSIILVYIECKPVGFTDKEKDKPSEFLFHHLMIDIDHTNDIINRIIRLSIYLRSILPHPVFQGNIYDLSTILGHSFTDLQKPSLELGISKPI